MLSLMWVLRVTTKVTVSIVSSPLEAKDLLWHNHLSKGQAVEDRPVCASLIITDVVQDNALTVVETNVELPVLPLQLPSEQLERDTLWLGDIDGLEVCPVTAALLNTSRGIVNRLDLAKGPTNLRDIDSDDGFFVGIIDGTEVERVRILVGVGVRTVVHEGLLKANIATMSLIIANSPRIAVDLVHVFFRDAGDFALLNHLGVSPADMLDKLELLHCDLRP